jgi:hypothetical protein
MTELAAPPRSAGRRTLSDVGLALTILLAVPLAMIVEDLSLIMARNAAGWGEFGVLALFALPLVTSWAAIAISLASRPLRLRLAAAAILLVVPPVLLLGLANA